MLANLLKENKGDFISLINYMKDAIFVMEVVDEGADFRYMAFNDEAMKVAGLSKDAVGKLIHEVMDEGVVRKLQREYGEVCLSKESRMYVDSSMNGSYGETVLTPIVEGEKVTHILGVTRNITKRKTAEKRLQQSEQKFKSLVENHPSAVFSLDLNGNFRSANRAAEELTGYNLNDFEGKPFTPMIPQAERERVFTFFSKARNGESVEYETKIILGNGQTKEMAITYIPITVEQEVVGIFGIAKDITREKSINRAIKENEERLRRLIDYSPDATLIHRDGFILYANKAAACLLELPGKEQLVGKSIYDFHPIRVRAKVRENIQRLYNGEDHLKLVEEKVQTVNGKELDVEVSRIEIMEKGERAVHSVIRNISGRKRIEEELKKSELRYRLIAENSKDLIQLVSVTGEVLYVSPSHKKVLGYDTQVLMKHSLGTCIHANDLNKFQTTLKEVSTNYGHASIELRAKHANGEWLWINIDMISIKDEYGKVEKVLLVGEEITEKKAYELKIHQMAFYDPLTTLPNRSLFKEKLKEGMEAALKNGQELAIMYVDCDNFKPINDELGHDAGDLFLKVLAERLKRSVSKRDTVARVGGDEFNIILTGITDRDQIKIAVEKLHRAANQPWNYEGQEWGVTLSIGIAIYPKDGTTQKTLIKKADMAMYGVKNDGKNMYSFYNE
ncbi:bifunctional diguanylate cyclase/phosphodiesterase [Litchfieldia alkalitelluris]|uniref:sensor domain-containing protein n=1 Tax=Litchfieldia alkalitelluris TaxID=304268 RepID=UPI000B44C527|nr:PAS domain S-box protein [Litchfieldia alkalitelluris]